MKIAVSFCALLLVTSSATAADPGTIHFAVTADQHYGWRHIPAPLHEGATIGDWMENPDLPDLDFVVATLGDWVSDHRLEDGWIGMDELWRQVAVHNANLQKLPYFYIIGNHDLSNYDAMPPDGNPMLSEQLGRRVAGMNENCFAFLYDNVLFIGLGQTNVLYHLSHFQRDWLTYLTGTYHEHTTVILTHQAIHETTGQGNFRATSWTIDDYKIYNDIEWWKVFFTENPQVKLYLHGHNEKAWNTVAADLHPDRWDDNCTFVMAPGTGKDYGQDAWSYVVSMDSDSLTVRLWDSEAHAFMDSPQAGVPFERAGAFQVSDSGMEWYSIPKQVLDGQSWQWSNRMLARKYQLELIGRETSELIDNPELDGCHESDEVSGSLFGGYWYAVRGDETALNLRTGEEDGLIRIAGGITLELAASGAREDYVEGKVPYNTGVAVAGKTYTFSADLCTEGGTGLIDILVSIPRRPSLKKFVWKDRLVAEGLVVSPEMQTFSATFTVPDDSLAWFIQPKLRLHNRQVIHRWDRWSLKMASEGQQTGDFRVTLNGTGFHAPGPLGHLEAAEFTFDPRLVGNRLDFDCAIGGNRNGMVRLIYRQPVLWSDDVSLGVLASDQSRIRIQDTSPFNDRTTVMGFGVSDPPLIRPGFSSQTVRGKPLCTHPSADTSLEGDFSIGPAPVLTLTAQATQVPAGGNFVFELSAGNRGDSALAIVVWTDCTDGTGQTGPPLKGPYSLVLGPGETRTWQGLAQPLGSAPTGTYRYRAAAGESLDGPLWAEAWCPFDILP